MTQRVNLQENDYLKNLELRIAIHSHILRGFLLKNPGEGLGLIQFLLYRNFSHPILVSQK